MLESHTKTRGKKLGKQIMIGRKQVIYGIPALKPTFTSVQGAVHTVFESTSVVFDHVCVFLTVVFAFSFLPEVFVSLFPNHHFSIARLCCIFSAWLTFIIVSLHLYYFYIV